MAEVRAQQMDLLARAKFIEAGKPVRETRSHLVEVFYPEVEEIVPMQNSATWLSAGLAEGLVEVG